MGLWADANITGVSIKSHVFDNYGILIVDSTVMLIYYQLLRHAELLEVYHAIGILFH